MRKRSWKSIFFNLISKAYKQAGRVGPLESDMMPIALLGFLLNTAQASGGKRPVFYVAASQSRAEQCRDDLTAWAEVVGKTVSMHALPDGSTRRQSLLQSDSPRAEALHRLLVDPPDVFFGSVTSLTSPAPVPRLMRESELVLKVGDEVDLKELAERLVEMGYDDEIEVGMPGEFARRGGLIDIFSSSEPAPARIEFFGDTIDSIRLFRPDTQTSTGRVDSYRVILRSGSGGDGTVMNGTE